ncbi:MAG: IPT/TIG domain-containing protein [Bryobacteraceae bacterium]
MGAINWKSTLTGFAALVLGAITVAPAAAQTAPSPNPSRLSPTSAETGTSINLSVFGTGFLQGDQIEWTPPNSQSGVLLSTLVVSPGEMRATVPSNLTATAGLASVRISYIRGGDCSRGCRTAPLTLLLTAPLRLLALNPSSAMVGKSVTLAASGTGFDLDAYLVWRRNNMEIRLSTIGLADPTEIRTTIPASLLTPAGSAEIFVVNGTECSGPCPRSNSLIFRITTDLQLLSITPNRASTRPADGPNQDILLAGIGFARNAKVLWRAGPRVIELLSSFVSDKELMASIPASLLTAPGTAFISVRNPGPLGESDETSNELLFVIEQGLSITRLDPLSVPAGSLDTVLSVFGLGLTDGIRIRLQAPGVPAVVPAGQIFDPSLGRIRATLPAGLLTTPITYDVVAFDPGIPTRVSNALPFTVTPGIRLTSLTPSTRVAGSTAFPLTIAGSGFTAGSRVLFGTRELIPVSVTIDRIDVSVPADAIAEPAIVPVKVRSLQGNESNSLNFTVSARALISSLDPPSRIAGSGAFTLAVNGSGFSPGARVIFGLRELFPSDIAAGRILVPVPADAIANPGTIGVKVRAADGAETNTVDFIVSTRSLISSLDPSTRPAGSGAFALTILGSGFASGSRVIFGTREFFPSNLTPDRIGVTIPADAIATPGLIGVKVRASDGVETNTVDFRVAAAPVIVSLTPPSRPAGSGTFTLIVDGRGFGDGSAVLFGSRRLIPTSIGLTQIRISVPADAITVAGRIPVKVTSSAGESNEAIFEVTAPTAVTLTSLNPTSRPAGSGDFDLTLTGTNMLPTPRVTFAGTVVPLVGTPSITTVVVRVPGALVQQGGPKTVEVTVAGNTASSTFNVTVAIPPAALSSATLTVAPGGNTTAQVTLSSAAQVPVNGRLELTFEPNASGSVAGFLDPAMMFVGGGARTLDFTIPAGQTQAPLAESGRINVGTVAGVVVLRLASLNSAGQPAASLPPPVRIEVPRAAPSLTAGSVRLTDSAGGVTVQVQGYSPGRDMTSATIAFTIAAQTDVDGSTTFNVPLQTVFQNFFNSADGRANGSRFQLRIPFTVDGDTSRITGVSVTLTNSEGQNSLTGGR